MSQNLRRLKALYQQYDDPAVARGATAVMINEAVALLQPPHASTAIAFCKLLATVTARGEALGSSALLEAACVPNLVDLMRVYPKNTAVMANACAVLLNLCIDGGPIAKTAIVEAGAEQLLSDAAKSGTAIDFGDGTDLAAEVLQALFLQEVRLHAVFDAVTGGNTIWLTSLQ